jgi:hypothetical protein
LLPTALRPQWAVLTPEALWCGYLGDEEAIAYYWMNLHKAKPQDVSFYPLEADVGFRRSLWQGALRYGSAEETFRASVPPVRIPDFVCGAGLSDWVADPAFGIVLGAVEHATRRDAIRKATTDVRGTVIFLAGSTDAPPIAPDHAVDVSTNSAERRIIDRLKRAFDPDDRLTPLPWHNR